MPNTAFSFSRRTRLLITSVSRRCKSLTLRRQLLTMALTAFFLSQPLVLKLITRVSADTSTPVSITAFGASVTENFDSLASSGTSSTTPTGWGFSESGTNANTIYTAGTGSGNSGDTYSFGATGNTERALGGLQSGSLVPIIGASFANNTGGTITSLSISYIGEQWRLGAAARTDRLDFQISTNATSLATGTYTDFDGLDFTAPVTSGTAGALDGNSAGNRTAVTNSISALNIVPGATFWIRWTDLNAAGADDGLSVDDFVLTAQGNAGDTAPEVSSTVPANNATNVAADADISITFSENVNVMGNWFQLSCTMSGLIPISDTVVSGGPLTFTINPNNNFANSEECNVTIFASQVTDQDANDPPDNMTANAIFSFTVATPPPPVAENVIINEVDSDTPGTDAAEFIELYDGGVGNTSLNGLVIVLYNGSNDLSYAAFDLDGRSTDANGYFVLGNAAVPGVDLVFAGNLLQNGADAVALYAGDDTNFPNNTPVSTVNLRDAVVYDTDDADDVGLLVLLNAGEPQVNENRNGSGGTDSVQRCPNGAGGARNTSTYTAGTATSDGVNSCQPPPPPAVARSIPEIQGSGTASAFAGTSVITIGVVTGRRSLGSNNNGFYIQDSTGDGLTTTSDAILVFTGSTVPTVAVGDSVQVTGMIEEFESSTTDEPDGVSPPDPKTATEITGPTIAVLSSNNALPAAVSSFLDPTASSRSAELEKYEFMRVSVDSLTVSQPTNTFGEFWGVETPRPRPFREPGIERGDPVPAADQGPFAGSPPPAPPIWDGNFERIMVDSGAALIAGGSSRRPQVQVTTGTVVTNVVGPLDYAFDNYRIVLDATVTPGLTFGVTDAIPVPVRTSVEFTIAHANLENFGASNANFADRLNKASLAIRNVLHSPDILGVIEVFDLNSLQQLANKINADANDPGVNYVAYLEEGAPNFGDDQDIGYLVNSQRVTVVGTPVQYHKDVTFTFSGVTDILHDRPSYVLTADVPQSGGGTFRTTTILNHTKSLIAVDSPRPYNGGPSTEGARNREKRRLQAEDIADLIETLQEENLVVLGDLNAFEFNDGLTDVLGTFQGTPAPPEQVVEPSMPDRWTFQLTNLLSMVAADQRYSFTFEGNAQVLDHVLVNNLMLARNSRFVYARYNADFSEAFADIPTRPERLSDHDAPVAYFEAPAPAIASAGSTLVNESCPAFNSAVDPGERVTVNLRLTNTGDATTSNLVATLQSSSGVVAPSGPHSYGAIAPGSTAGRDFSFTAVGTCGDTITATLQLQDGATNLGTVTYSFRLGVDTGHGFICTSPCGGVRLVVTSRVTRGDASTVHSAITVQNIGSATASDVKVTTARLGSTLGAPLPQSLGNLAPGATGNAVLNFANSTPGASSMLTVGGTYTGGTFSSSKRVTIP